MPLPIIVGIIVRPIVRQALLLVVKKYGKKLPISFIRKECVSLLRLWLKNKTKGIIKYSKKDIQKAIDWFENPNNETAIESWLDSIRGALDNAISSVRTESNIGRNPENLLDSGFSPQNAIEAGKQVQQGVPFGTLLIKPQL